MRVSTRAKWASGLFDQIGSPTATIDTVVGVIPDGRKIGALSANVADKNRQRIIDSWIGGVLGIPLELKILGATALILGIAALVLWTHVSISGMRWADLGVLGAALAMGACVNFALVRLALRPVKDLQRVARRVSEGRLGERVPHSLVADPGLAHLATTMNKMLDTLAAGRERMRRIGADVIFAQERERAQVARDLHDSVAQTLAAASFQIAAAVNDLGAEAGSTRLPEARELLRIAVEEIRNLSRSLHPRIADDLGLPAALEALADSTRQRALVDVHVHTYLPGVTIPAPLGTTLYRVAQEALRNIEKHADAANATVALRVRNGIIELEVSDDGRGFDGSDASIRRNSALDLIRERLALAGGELLIDSTLDTGTRVFARVRMHPEAA